MDDVSSKSYAFISVPGDVFRKQARIDQTSQRSKLSWSHRQNSIDSLQGRPKACVVCNAKQELGVCPTCRSINCKTCYKSRGRPQNKLCAICIEKQTASRSERGRQRSRNERAKLSISQNSRKAISAIASCFGKRDASPDSRANDFTPPTRSPNIKNTQIQENASNDDLKATLAELRFLKTQRFREMKPIDEGNAQLAKEEERLRAMDAHIAELERGNEIGMARIEEFKSKFFAESARRSHLKTQFVQAGEEIKKINQKKVESEKLKAHYLRIEHLLQLEMAEIEELENELRRLSAQKQRSRNSSQRHSQRASVSSEKLAHSRSFSGESRNERLSEEWPVLSRSMNLDSEPEYSNEVNTRASMAKSLASSQRSSARSQNHARYIRRVDDERKIHQQHQIAVMRREMPRHETSPAQTEMLSSFNTERLFRANAVFRPMFPMHNRPAQITRSSNQSAAVRDPERVRQEPPVPKFFRKFL